MQIRGKSWDDYWKDSAPTGGLYALRASLYRKWLIAPSLGHYFRKYFPDTRGRIYLHAGCGSSESDARIGHTEATFVLMDISYEALLIARRTTRFKNVHFVCGDLFRPPFRTSSVDGVWNLGVMEHFYEPEIVRIFEGIGRVLKPRALCLILWPPVYGFSVLVLTSFLFIADRVLGRRLTLYPDEVSRFRSAKWADALLTGSGVSVERTHFGLRDLFTYVILVGRASKSETA